MKLTATEIKTFIKSKLGSDRRWAEKALFALYNHQTEDEKVFRDSGIVNGVGFTQYDASKLTEIVNDTLRKRRVNRNYQITGKDLAILFRRLPKYWKQILNLSKAKSLCMGFDELELLMLSYKNHLSNVGIQESFI